MHPRALLVLAPLALPLAACGSASQPTDAATDHLAPTDASAADGAPDALADTTVPPLDALASPDAPDPLDAASDAPDPSPDGATPDAGRRLFPGAYASPSIVRDGATFHAYFAAQTIRGRHYHTPHATFTAAGEWTFVGEAMPSPGAQADPGGAFWAPGVAQIDATHWVLYYTAHLLGTDQKKCIWRAHSATPDGPFVDDSDGPLVCPPDTLWAIDAYPVRDARGNWNLAARIDQPGGINTIQLRQLGALGQDFAPGSSWVQLTQNAPTSWEQPVLENAGVVRLSPPGGGEAHWFVFYSARAWDDDSYAIGYADCGPGLGDGACVKRTPTGPWLATDRTAGVFAPGTPTFYTDTAGEMLMSVQAWQYTGGTSNPRNTGQIMRTYAISVDDGYVPHVVLRRVDD